MLSEFSVCYKLFNVLFLFENINYRKEEEKFIAKNILKISGK
jgi:hypothetical protein